MTTNQLRNLFHKQIDTLPDHLLQQVFDFSRFLQYQEKLDIKREEWTEELWQEFALAQFFSAYEEEEVEYSIKDAREVYHT